MGGRRIELETAFDSAPMRPVNESGRLAGPGTSKKVNSVPGLAVSTHSLREWSRSTANVYAGPRLELRRNTGLAQPVFADTLCAEPFYDGVSMAFKPL
jgi:hypothetical protein